MLCGYFLKCPYHYFPSEAIFSHLSIIILILDYFPKMEPYKVLLNMNRDNGCQGNLKIEKHYTNMEAIISYYRFPYLHIYKIPIYSYSWHFHRAPGTVLSTASALSFNPEALENQVWLSPQPCRCKNGGSKRSRECVRPLSWDAGTEAWASWPSSGCFYHVSPYPSQCSPTASLTKANPVHRLEGLAAFNPLACLGCQWVLAVKLSEPKGSFFY